MDALPAPVNHDRSALLLVDIQPDFLPGGALPVADGDAILDGVRALMQSGLFGVEVATQDWHPADHVSFADNHEGREPMEVIDLHGHDQVLWPAHCVQSTPGAELHPGLPWDRVTTIVRKGTNPETDSYSGFRNNWDARGTRAPTGLAGYLSDRGIETVYVCGLARDVCVKWTAEDAADAGFGVVYLWDLTRAVDPSSDALLRSDFSERGIVVADSAHLRAAGRTG